MADRQYELLYILPPDSTEQQVAELHEQIASVVSRLNGQIEKTDNWGRRRLAYEIQKNAEGIYAVVTLTAEPATVKEFDRQLTLNESILRTKVMRPSAH